MAQGLGQFAGDFADPPVAAGVTDWEGLTDMDPSSPYVSGPAVGGWAPSQAGDTGLVHVAAGGQGPDDSLMPHWSNLMNFSHSTMPWLLLIALFFFGVMHFTVSGRVGR